MKNKLTLLIILALLISCVLAFASCGETPQNTDTSTNTNTGTSSGTDTNGDVNTDTGTGDVTPDVPTEYIIEEADGFDFDTDTKKVYKNISNATEMIDLSNSFKVTEGATWKLYKDFLGENEYKLKSMSLSIGENKAYIVVYHPNGEDFTRYELVLYRLDMKDYSFTTDNAPYEDGTIEELSSVEAPATNPQKVGYDFKGWTVDGEIVSFPYQVSVDTVFEAKFAPIEYEIEYNLNGGVNNAENSLKYNIEQSVELLAPARDFYTFAGWYESDDFAGNATAKIAEGSYGNKTFYAKWTPITYNITYELNGGTNNAENPNTYNTEISIELKAPTKAGYTFAGWFADKDFSVETTGISLGEGDAKTFYAKWNANENTIVFNANSGSGSMLNMTLATNSTANLTANVFVKDGYTFKGWATSKGGSVVYADGASYTMGTNSSYTLYAVWEANKNTLIFNANGGTGSMPNMTIATDRTAKLTSNAFTKDGYTFIGWATSKDGSVKYSNNANYTMGTESTYTLYAVWEKNINGLIFNGNGATSGSMSSVEIATGETASIPNNSFIRNGYTFIGWSTSANGGVVYTNSASYTMGTGATYVLYAVWQANENTIVFNGNGATSGSMSSMTVKTDETVTLLSNKFAKTGYTFKGWSTTANGAVTYKNGTSYTMGTDSVYTLYAVWEANLNTIIFNGNGATGGSTQSMTVATDSTATLNSNGFVRAGYTFRGWSTTKDGSIKYSNGASYTMGADSTYTLYAVWRVNENTLVFNGNGATSGTTPSMTIATDDTAVLTANGFVRDGYTFKGWSTSASGSVKYTDGASYTMGTSIQYTLYAVWEAKENTLVFDGNGATSGSMSDMIIATDNTDILINNKFAKTGYTFKGWSSTKNGSVEYQNGSAYTMGTESVATLYAVWEANRNTIVFNGNGATGGSMQSMTVSTDSTASLTQSSYTKTGYTFIGWSTTKGGSVEYTDKASYTMGTNSSYTLYAVWEANENTLIFNANSGLGNMSNMTISTDETVNLSNNKFVKAGYTFKGWATSAGGSVIYSNGASYTMGTNNSYTLYAVWEANENTLIFDGNGETVGSMSDMTIATDKTATLPNNAFVKKGYTFKGWSTTRGGNVEYTDGASYTMGASESYTLYAVWEMDVYEINYVLNGGKNDSSNPTEYNVYSSIASFAIPKRNEHYIFKGWFTDNTFENSITSIETGSTGNITLYAKWEAVKYTITYETNGGTLNDSAVTEFTVEDLPLYPKAYLKDYTFVGWFFDSSLEGNAILEITTAQNTSLYAKYEYGTDGIIYAASENGYEVIGYNGIDTDVIIPETHSGLPVVSISSSAFNGQSSITDIIVPNSVTLIGEGAFSGCSKLESITIPFVGGSASATSESRLTLFGYIFGTISYTGGVVTCQTLDCYSSGRSEYYYIPSTLKKVTITGGNRINSCSFYNCSTLTNIIIPDSVTSIESYAFYDCDSLTSVSIPDGVTAIYDYTFFSCGSLTSIDIPDSVSSIYDEAFKYCKSLTSITIPANVDKIGLAAFHGCESLTSATFINSNRWWIALTATATGGTYLQDLDDPSIAAATLTKYTAYYWRRS